MKKQLAVLSNKFLSRIALSSIVCILSFGAYAEKGAMAPGSFQEGTHYDKLTLPLRTRYPGQVEVTEYFSYGCPHCKQFDPILTAWSANLPNDVIFNRTPAMWNADYEVFAHTYYTAIALKVLDKIHEPLFRAIHDERKNLSNPQDMAAFFQKFGVDPMDFAKMYKSFGVRTSVQQAVARGRAYKATGVPTLIINGKYRIEGKHAGNNPNMLLIAEYLIEREREALAK